MCCFEYSRSIAGQLLMVVASFDELNRRTPYQWQNLTLHG